MQFTAYGKQLNFAAHQLITVMCIEIFKFFDINPWDRTGFYTPMILTATLDSKIEQFIPINHKAASLSKMQHLNNDIFKVRFNYNFGPISLFAYS